MSAIRSCIAQGWFVAGRRVDLSGALTLRVLSQRLPVHRWGMFEWFRARHEVGTLGALTRRDRRRVGARGVPEFVPHDRTYGYLLGVNRRDFERVNGFDMRYEGWGEEDIDLAVRLRRLGLRCGWPGPQGTLLHLWHESRKRAQDESLLDETRTSARVEAVLGLREVS